MRAIFLDVGSIRHVLKREMLKCVCRRGKSWAVLSPGDATTRAGSLPKKNLNNVLPIKPENLQRLYLYSIDCCKYLQTFRLLYKPKR